MRCATHCLSCLQPPLLIGLLAKNTATQRELINYAMICSGVFTLIHCVQFPMPFGRVYGSGILSCTGEPSITPALDSPTMTYMYAEPYTAHRK